MTCYARLVPRVVKPGFRDDVIRIVRQVPEGRVTTYGDVAGALGARNVARHVGWALAGVNAEDQVPWHRVVNSKGYLSLDLRSAQGVVQRTLLQAEGVKVDDKGKIVAFNSLRFQFPEGQAQGG